MVLYVLTLISLIVSVGQNDAGKSTILKAIDCVLIYQTILSKLD